MIKYINRLARYYHHKGEKVNFEKLDMQSYQHKKCKWAIGAVQKDKDPHFHSNRSIQKKIYNNVIEAMHSSPMIKLNKIPATEGIKCEILAKCEFLLPGGSFKDRIAKRMIEDAEKSGKLKPGDTIIEASSGNTGIAVALIGAVKGNKVVITIPERMSEEKISVLNSLGAEVIRTPNDAKFGEFESHIGVAIRKGLEIENSILLDQYSNPSNPMAHYDETAEEIWEQCEGKLDYVVIAAGTGGALTGISRKLKEKNKEIKIIGVDPYGSIMAYPDSINGPVLPLKIEGIGHDFIPKTLNRTDEVDEWIKTDEKTSFEFARRLIKEEGLLVGGSSGACIQGACEIAKKLPADKRVICIFTDSVRNYLTKFVSDDWLLENNFMNQEKYDEKHINNPNIKLFGDNLKIKELILPEVKTIKYNSTIKEVLEEFKIQKFEIIPISGVNNEIIGVITLRQVLNFLSSYRLTVENSISRAIIKEFKKLKVTDPLKYLSKAFNRHSHVLVYNEEINKYYIATPQNLLGFMEPKIKI